MKYKLYTMLFVLMLVTIFTVSAQSIESPQINISLMNQDPDPVDPGQYVEVRFLILNEYPGSTAGDFQVMLDPQYPFSLDSNENALRDIGDLPALGDGQNVIVVKYKIRVDEDAVEGENPIRIKYKHDSTLWISKEFDINVQTVDANLAVVSVQTEPDLIKPGEEVKLNVKVKNMADSTMKDVSFKLDLTLSTFLSQATLTASDSVTAFNALPFAPIGSTSEKKIYSLESGGEHIFSYDLITYSDAESRVYKVPIIITYYDELETQYVKTDIIGLIVGTKPDLSVVIDETELHVGRRTGNVIIRFINKGFSDVKFLDVNLRETDEFELLSSSEVYVGNVDSDDYETAEYEIYMTNGAAREEKTITLPLYIEYKDANNNVYTEEYDLPLKILEPEKLGIQSGVGTGTVLLVVIVIGAIVFFYLRRRRKKKKK